MNLGISQTSRTVPDPGRSEMSQGIALAKRMGINFNSSLKSSSEKQRGSIQPSEQTLADVWGMLDHLCESDPEAYAAFVKEQIEGMEGITNGKERTSPPQTIKPQKGFVVKATILSSAKGKTEKLFVNFCQHEAVQSPVDSNGNPVHEERLKNLSDLRIPLAVSGTRKCPDSAGDSAHAVDVVLNPRCIQRCSSDSFFKLELIRLGLTWVEKECGIKIDRNVHWKAIKSSYKGGTGKGGREVLDFRSRDRMNGDADDSEITCALANLSRALAGDDNVANKEDVRNDPASGTYESNAGNPPEYPELDQEPDSSEGLRGAHNDTPTYTMTHSNEHVIIAVDMSLAPAGIGLREVDLEVSERAMRMKVSQGRNLHLKFESDVNPDGAVAKWNKKKEGAVDQNPNSREQHTNRSK